MLENSITVSLALSLPWSELPSNSYAAINIKWYLQLLVSIPEKQQSPMHERNIPLKLGMGSIVIWDGALWFWNVIKTIMTDYGFASEL